MVEIQKKKQKEIDRRKELERMPKSIEEVLTHNHSHS